MAGLSCWVCVASHKPGGTAFGDSTKLAAPGGILNDTIMTTDHQQMRASGVRDILIYCRDHRCSHHVETNADGWPDDVRLSDIEPSLICSRCGKKGDPAKVSAGAHGHRLGKFP